MYLPNFFIAGMPRCGTTAVHHVLSEHPDIYLSRGSIGHMNNELWYFCHKERYANGINWYSDFFKDAGEKKYIGEKTPWYMRVEAIKRIKEDIGPSAKFLMCVRDPILRPFSHWIHARDHAYGEKYLGTSFGRVIRDRAYNWSFITGSSYGRHVRNFVEFYPRENLHIVVNEELKADPYGEYGKIFDWLGLEPLSSIYHLPHKKINLSKYKKHDILSEEDRYFLKETLKYDTEEFYNFIGREIEIWK